MTDLRYLRRSAPLALAATAVLVAAAACSSGSSSGTGCPANGAVTISIDCAPPASSPAQHAQWTADVAAFEKRNPDITINSIYTSPCEVPATSSATSCPA
jgi:ABC-type glycerol-3-phosphate transport system substrate-binding protein